MKRKITVILLLFIFNLSLAQELKTEYHEAVKTFVDCIKNNNTDKLQTRVTYPLRREYPLSDVKNEIEFKKRYSEIFDVNLKDLIIASSIKNDWFAVGWRGIMLNKGDLWLDYSGRLLSVNYQSEFERGKRIRLIEKDKNSINESLKDFEEPIIIIKTKKFKIRIDKLDNEKYRYASWSIDSEMSEKPDLIIKNGIWVPEGSGGNHRYEFVNGNFKYECSINILRADGTPPADLIVYKNNDEILNDPALIIKK